MATPKPSGPIAGRPEHPNWGEAEKNDLKYNFMKMIETFKEEMKNFLKEMEENIFSNKKLKEIKTLLNKPKKKHQISKANSSNSSILDKWNRGNKDSTNWVNSENRKSG